MVARGDLGAELPIEDVPLLQVNVWLQSDFFILLVVIFAMNLFF